MRQAKERKIYVSVYTSAKVVDVREIEIGVRYNTRKIKKERKGSTPLWKTG